MGRRPRESLTDGARAWTDEIRASGHPHIHRRAHAKAAVALRGPLADVLLVFYRRLPRDSDRAEVLGEVGLLDGWLAATARR